jgi:hypothetical protein
MTHDLKITISGPAKSGKSWLAAYLWQALKNIGAQVDQPFGETGQEMEIKCSIDQPVSFSSALDHQRIEIHTVTRKKGRK